jgi:hypothetical protein
MPLRGGSGGAPPAPPSIGSLGVAEIVHFTSSMVAGNKKLEQLVSL